MHKNNKIRCLLLLMAVTTSIAGCSTYERYRAYKNNSSNIIHHSDIEGSITFDRYIDFYSIGILGLPVIPVYLRINNEDEIELSVYIRMIDTHEFSLSSRPCLLLEDENKLCARKLEVNSMALVQDDGSEYNDKLPRWNHIPAFKKIDNLTVIHSDKAFKPRVNTQDIYKFYNYNGVPAWGHFTTSFIYSFACNGKCPLSFKLEDDDFIIFDGEKINLGRKHYTLEKDSEYYFTRNIQ